MSHAVILDDLEVRHEAAKVKFGTEYTDIKHCYNMAEFVHHILTYPAKIDFVSLDHDLGDHTVDSHPIGRTLYGTGMDAAKLLCAIEENMRPTKVNVHSHNYVRGEAMWHLLKHFGYPDATFEHFTDD